MIKHIFSVLLLMILVVSCSVDEDANRNAGLGLEDDEQMSNDDDMSSDEPESPANATYMVTFVGEWTEASHPNSFPNNDHFSRTILLTHNTNVSLYRVGELASDGIEDMSEVGNNDDLVLEMQSYIDSGDANAFEVGPGSIAGNGTDELIIEATQDASKLSYVAMIAPSPDWFTGVSSISLYENGEWLDRISVDVVAYDAGTEEGNSFRYDNPETSPREPISEITEAPLGNGTGVSPRLGYLLIERQ